MTHGLPSRCDQSSPGAACSSFDVVPVDPRISNSLSCAKRSTSCADKSPGPDSGPKNGWSSRCSGGSDPREIDFRVSSLLTPCGAGIESWSAPSGASATGSAPESASLRTYNSSSGAWPPRTRPGVTGGSKESSKRSERRSRPLQSVGSWPPSIVPHQGGRPGASSCGPRPRR
jgi:hypothetical protein